MDLKHSIVQHLIKISAMIHDPKAITNLLTKDEQIQADLYGLPKSWDTMKVMMMHYENIYIISVAASSRA